jgi:predicted dehydrogenase
MGVSGLRVGIIGAGRAGAAHAAAYRQLPGVAVSAVWSRTPERARALAAVLAETAPAGASPPAVYDRWEDLLERGDVDAVSLTTPGAVRHAPFAAALGRGRHVLVEKPLSLELPEARAIAGLAAGGETVTAVSFNWRYAPRVQAAGRAVRAGEIGPVREVRASTTIVAGPAFFGLLRQKPWSTRREHGGGMLREAGTHMFDRVRFLTGQEFRRVAGRLTPFAAVPWPVPEAAGATGDLEFALLAELTDGSLASLQVALTAAAGGEQLVLSGADGVLTVGPQGVLRQRAGECATRRCPTCPRSRTGCGPRRSSPPPSGPTRSAAGSTSPSWAEDGPVARHAAVPG